jgi:hypothetical protein
MLQIVVLKYWDVEGDILCGVTLKNTQADYVGFKDMYLVHNLG